MNLRNQFFYEKGTKEIASFFTLTSFRKARNIMVYKMTTQGE